MSVSLLARGRNPVLTRLPGIDTSTPAVVLKLRPAVVSHGELGAIRSLGRIGVAVYGVHSRASDPVAHSKYLSGGLLWRPDPEQAEHTRAGLVRLAERIGATAVLIAVDDASAVFLAEHGAGLRRYYAFPEPPPGLTRRLADKHTLYELCGQLGVPAPRTCLVTSAEQARRFAGDVGYPLIAKLTTAWRMPHPALLSTSLIRSVPELDHLARACEGMPTGLILQELIPSSPGCDWFFSGYCDARSVCTTAFTGRRARSYPAYAGTTCLGHAVRNDDLRKAVVRLLTLISYRGVADLDLRLNDRTGEYLLLDFNPRIGAQFRVFLDRSGLDLVLAAYLDLTGQQVTVGEQVEGRGFLVENCDPVSARDYRRGGDLTWRAWLGSLRNVNEVAWFARDDLRPFGLICARAGARAFTRQLARRHAGSGGASPAPSVRGGADEPRYRPGRAGSAAGR